MTKLALRNMVLCYDGSLEGFLCAVFDAYALRCHPEQICAGEHVQMRMGSELVEVRTDKSHAERVRVGLTSHAGVEAYRTVKTAFLSDEEGREDVLFSYIVRAMERGHRVHGDMTVPCVSQARELVTQVLNERERMYQFLRFEKLEGDVYFARINPRACVLPIMMEHFVQRFNTQAFVIYDEVHRLAGVHSNGQSTLVIVDDIALPARAADEHAYQLLWKRFYDAVSNEQRYNPDLRRALVPKRLWRNITEFKLAAEGSS